MENFTGNKYFFCFFVNSPLISWLLSQQSFFFIFVFIYCFGILSIFKTLSSIWCVFDSPLLLDILYCLILIFIKLVGFTVFCNLRIFSSSFSSSRTQRHWHSVTTQHNIFNFINELVVLKLWQYKTKPGNLVKPDPYSNTPIPI